MFRKLILAVLLALMFTACKQTEFTGGSGTVKKPAIQNVTPEDPSTPLGTNTTGTGSPIDDGTVEVEDDPGIGTGEDNDDPGLDTGSDVDDGISFLDIIGGLIDTLKDVEIGEDEDGITFGGRKKFRIGDGEASGSTCQGGLAVQPLSGTKFFFEFEVKENNTNVSIDIESICGVDYGDSNFAYVESLDNGQKYGQKTLPVGADEISLNNIVLNKGHYAVAVESTISQGSGGGTDADDYVVGVIRINGNKPMTAGKVGAL